MKETGQPDGLPAVIALSQFDELAPMYEGWFTTRMGRFVDKREKDLLAELIRPKAGQTILEVGSGTGHFLRGLAESGARCVGIEPSRGMLRAGALPRHKIDSVQGVAEALPFRDQSFDSLLYMTTLEFVTDVDTAIEDATRVVRRDGRMVFAVLNAEAPWARARQSRGGVWTAARFYRAEELEALLSNAGLVQLHYCIHVAPRLGWMPEPLLGLIDSLWRFFSPKSGALIAAVVTPRRQQ